MGVPEPALCVEIHFCEDAVGRGLVGASVVIWGGMTVEFGDQLVRQFAKEEVEDETAVLLFGVTGVGVVDGEGDVAPVGHRFVVEEGAEGLHFGQNLVLAFEFDVGQFGFVDNLVAGCNAVENPVPAFLEQTVG